MSCTTTMPINGEKLRLILKDRTSESLSEISRNIGYANGYIKNVIAANKISKVTANVLEHMYGIHYADYMPDEPKPVEQPKVELDESEKSPREIDIEIAVYQGIMRAMDDIQGDLQTILYHAIYGAIKKLGDNNDAKGGVIYA